MTKEEWSEKRSELRYQNSILDPSFDQEVGLEAGLEDGSVEVLVHAGNFGRHADFAGKGFGRASGMRKRRTITTDDPDFVTVPESPPPGWAEP